MPNDYVPQSPQNLKEWSDNFTTKLPTQAGPLGMSGSDVTELTDRVNKIGGLAGNVVTKQQELDDAVGSLHSSLQAELPEVRRAVREIKANKKYDEGIGADLQIVGHGDAFDAENFKPIMTAEAFSGYVRIKGRKRGADAFNVYKRLKGQANFNLVVARRSRFPFDDDSPLAQANVPETREYRVIGVLADREIGQPSDIVSVVFGG